MCRQVVTYWRDCGHTELIGSMHCGLDTSDPNHFLDTDRYEQTGFECEICLKQRGETIDPDDVKWYPATDLRVTLDSATGRIIPCPPTPPHKRHPASLSGASDSDSYSSPTTITLGLPHSSRSSPPDAPDAPGAPRGPRGPRDSDATGSSAARGAPVSAQDGNDLPSLAIESQEHHIGEPDWKSEHEILTASQAEFPLLGVTSGELEHRALLQEQLHHLPRHLMHLEKSFRYPTHTNLQRWSQAPPFIPTHPLSYPIPYQPLAQMTNPLGPSHSAPGCYPPMQSVATHVSDPPSRMAWYPTSQPFPAPAYQPGPPQRQVMEDPSYPELYLCNLSDLSAAFWAYFATSTSPAATGDTNSAQRPPTSCL
ncbi:hypothetical protein K469DRAFT_371744 [Zopfia rhizophila CBS 207.26]|uniref:Uncharacterized protein n=1 Tax=Zopfia rhizophila CBS 207.26 TaxID=1314779 RepID=A0A6A6EJY7_9PEZI|nr:hypothetical protein K469DRAFT_371744 [Zopfia rhizophila CBS 207.26]